MQPTTEGSQDIDVAVEYTGVLVGLPPGNGGLPIPGGPLMWINKGDDGTLAARRSCRRDPPTFITTRARVTADESARSAAGPDAELLDMVGDGLDRHEPTRFFLII